MSITRTVLEERITSLQAEVKKAESQFHVLSGALADAKYWLKLFDEDSKGNKEKEA